MKDMCHASRSMTWPPHLQFPSYATGKGTLELNSSYLDASHGTELVLDSNWHTTGSHLACNWHSRKSDQVQSLLDPLRLPHTALLYALMTGQAERS